jgi:hypothetical protein
MIYVLETCCKREIGYLGPVLRHTDTIATTVAYTVYSRQPVKADSGS